MQRFRKKMFRRMAVGIVIAALATTAAMTVSADDVTDSGTGNVTGNVTVNGTIMPLTISVSHPINVAYAIDPNTNAITAPAITLKNNSTVPINVSVQTLKSASGGSIQFTDVDPASKTWDSLNAADTKKYIALGVNISDATGWDSGYATSTDWASGNTAVQFGSLASGNSGNLSLTAKFGRAWDGNYTAQHSLVFMFSMV